MVKIPSAIKLTFNKILIFDRENMHLGETLFITSCKDLRLGVDKASLKRNRSQCPSLPPKNSSRSCRW